MINVVIADDSPTARETLREILALDPSINIVGEANNGLEAVKLVEELRPNLVIMDVNMPFMNGFEATKEVMIRVPTPTLIITGDFDVDDPLFTGNSFRCGALTALPKFPGVDAPEFDAAVEQFLRTVRQMTDAKVCRHWRYAPMVLGQRGVSEGVRAVGVTVSNRGAGGLRELIRRLPEDFPVPILVVPHIGHGFHDGFTAWLARAGGPAVRIARQGETLEPATVYVAPEHVHLGVNADAVPVAVNLHPSPPIRGYRPSASYLFSSLADAYGHDALALYLRGVPEDSMLGLCAIRLEGGRVLAQDEGGATSTSDQLCQGLADAILSIDHIASQLQEVVRMPEPETEEKPAEAAGASITGSLRLALH